MSDAPRRSDRILAMQGRVVHAKFKTPLPGYLVEITAEGGDKPLTRIRLEANGTFSLPAPSDGDLQVLQLRVLDPAGRELDRRVIKFDDAQANSLEFAVAPRRRSPRAGAWADLRQDLTGVPISTVGAFFAELERPTQPGTAEWDPAARRKFLRAAEVEYLDPTGALRKHVDADALRLRALRDPRERGLLERKVRASAQGLAAERQVQDALRLLRRRVVASPSVRDSSVALSELPKIFSKLIPSSLDDVLKAAKIDGVRVD